MTQQGFLTKKPKLFGSSEDSIGIIATVAVAGLGGSLSLATGDTDAAFNAGATSIGAGQAPSTNAGDVAVTVSVINSNSIVVFAIGGGASDSGGFQNVSFNVEESSVVKASTGLNQSAVAFNIYGYAAIAIIFNVSIGSHTYDIIRTSGTIHATKVTVEVIEVNDTHAGNIAVEATATKQINAADSHDTKNSNIIKG